MSPLIIVLLVLAGIAVLVASTALVSILQRRDVLLRASEEGLVDAATTVLRPEQGPQSRLKERLEQWAKEREDSEALQNKLIQAGFEAPTAPAIYFLVRVSSVVLLPLIAALFIPKTQFLLFVMTVATGLFLGAIFPMAMLDRFVRLRQERIKKSVPDALDLLVVCVEAGTSLDAAILRVAKELRLAHPDLAHELAVVNRLTNAGMPREEALRGLWKRTGVLDIRALVSSLIQSEKWGTSIATVLRVAAETLRRKRRQDAERRAKMAPLKMTFPLLFFILPALFAVILGPAVVQIINEFGKI
ncbi:MAG TPA: type II secretion system F family protein [Gemmatimonadaceae bacterium]